MSGPSRNMQSNDYHGPDMTNFGHRALQDDEFNELYKEEMSKFKQHILNDDSFAKIRRFR